MLDFADKALNQMSLPITPLVVLTRRFGVSLRRDHCFRTAGGDFIQKIVRAVAAVGQHILELKVNNQIVCFDNIMALSSGQIQAQRIAQAIHSHMDFGAEAASTASQGLCLLSAVFWGAPAAQAWARTIVLSIMPFSMSGSVAKCSSIRSQTPLSHQRANRLYTLFHFPYSAGKNRHWAPLRLIHSTASTKRRQLASFPTYTFGSSLRKSRIFVHWSSWSFAFDMTPFYSTCSNVNRA